MPEMEDGPGGDDDDEDDEEYNPYGIGRASYPALPKEKKERRGPKARGARSWQRQSEH